MTTPVVLVDDDDAFRASLRLLVELEPDLAVVGEFGDAADCVAAAAAGGAAAWRLVLMDVEMPRMRGVDGTRALKRLAPDVAVVMLTVFDDPATVVAAICAGADGYLTKASAPTDLIAQVRAVLAGGSPLTPAVARHLVGALRAVRGDRSAPAPGLSPREQAVLALLVDGLAYKQVAAQLGIGIDTVRTHIRGLYKKLQVHSVAEAVARALREGLV